MDVITSSKQRAVRTMEQFLRNFSHVPDERLHWSPSPSAKSPLRIAAHTALYAARFAAMIRERQLISPPDLAEWLEERDKEEEAVATREEVVAIFRAGTDEVLAALDSLNEEDLLLILESDQGWTMPMTLLIDLPAFHAALHMGQIDLLQTCWGDQKVYVG
jgi:hypothetical protein